MQRTKSTKKAREKRREDQEEVVNIENKHTDITGVHEVVVVRNKILRRTLYILPWVSIAGAIVGIIYFTRRSLLFDITHLADWHPDTINYYVGMFLAPIGLFLFRVLAKRVPQVFVSIAKQNIITAPNENDSDGAKKTRKSSLASPQDQTSLFQKYQRFLDMFERALNHPVQWLIGGVLALVVIVWQEGFERGSAFIFGVLRNDTGVGLLMLGLDVIRFLLVGMVGILLWRVLVIGVYIWRLGKAFKITPQLGHPDLCGGLEPLGNLCLWIVLLLAIPALYLVGWILPSQLLHVSTTNRLYLWVLESARYSGLYSVLLLLLIILSLVSFFIPLWSVHQSMLQNRTSVKGEMDDLAKSIAEIEKTLLDKAKTMDQNKADELLKRLKTMQEVYQRNKNYPTWPFNVKGLLKFFSVQLFPFLVSLGLMEPIISKIKEFISLILQ